MAHGSPSPWLWTGNLYKVHRHSFPASLPRCEAVSMRISYLVFGLLLLCLVPAPGKLGWGAGGEGGGHAHQSQPLIIPQDAVDQGDALHQFLFLIRIKILKAGSPTFVDPLFLFLCFGLVFSSSMLFCIGFRCTRQYSLYKVTPSMFPSWHHPYSSRLLLMLFPRLCLLPRDCFVPQFVLLSPFSAYTSPQPCPS